MEHIYLLVWSLIMIYNAETANITERGEPQLSSDNATIQRISDLESFLLPLPAEEIEQVVNETLMRYVPVNSESELCRTHSLLVVQSFHQRHLWALKMLDAGSKMMSGVLDGNLQDLGNFEQCINIVQPDSLFSTKHCVIQTAGFLNKKIQLDKLYPTDITFSLCVPSSCSVEDVAAHVDSVLAQVNATTVYSFVKNSGVEVGSLDRFLTCSQKTKPGFRPEDYVALIFFTIAGCILISLSLFETKFGAKSVFSGISLSSSFKGLMDTSVPQNEISCLNGLRVIFIILVVAYHRLYSMMYLIPSNRRRTIVQTLSSVTLRLMEASTISLDVFFLIGGIVCSYTFLSKKDKKKQTTLWKSILMRYFRLTPALAVLMLFYATLSIHTSRGPIWPQSAAWTEEPCRSHWWTGLLHISNYYNPGPDLCVSQSWYVAADFQLYVLSPLILAPIHDKPKLAPFIIIVNIIVPVIVITAKSFIDELYPSSMLNLIELQRDTNDSKVVDYQGLHFRIAYYVMGIGLGYILFLIKHNKKEISFSKPFFTLGWSLAGLVLTTYVIVSLIIFHPDHIFKLWFDPFFIGLAKPLACAALAWVIFACSLGHGGLVNRFLSWSAFRPLARLVYGVYLIHVLVMITQTFSVQVPQAFSFRDYIFLLCGDTTVSFFLAMLLYITVEVPCYKLANNILSDKNTDEVKNLTSQQLPSTI